MKKILLTLAFVVGIAGFTQYIVSHITLKSENNRQVANFGERDSDEQIQWEHRLAIELSGQSEHLKKANQPNWQDQLIYEFLMGQYDIQTDQGLIKKFVLQNSQNGVDFSADRFVSLYGKKFKDYSSFKIVHHSGQSEKIEFYDKESRSMGSITINRQANGTVTEIIF